MNQGLLITAVASALLVTLLFTSPHAGEINCKALTLLLRSVVKDLYCATDSIRSEVSIWCFCRVVNDLSVATNKAFLNNA